MSRPIVSVMIMICLTGCSDQAENKVNPAKTAVTAHPGTIGNTRLNQVLDSYSQLTESFVQWDSAGVMKKAIELNARLDSLEVNTVTENSEQQKKLDVLIGHAKRNIMEMAKAKNIARQRHQFDSLSKTLFSVLKSGELYNGSMYLQVCPMAFNDTDSGYWLSTNIKIRNPYLGLHHPRYHGGMLECGETMDSIKISQ